MMSGSPFDIETLVGEYPESSVEALALHAMHNSAATYPYNSLNELTFELRLRGEIVKAAHALDRSAFRFAVFHKSKADPDYWERTPNGGFRLKPGLSPSAAIRDIFENGGKYATECATGMVIVYYKALLELFGEETFSRLFQNIYLMNWHIEEPLLAQTGIPRKVPELLPGDRGYFANPDVDPQAPQWQGENVIVLPDGLYYGHGIGIRNAEGIIRALNANRREGAEQPAHLLESAGRPDFKRLSEDFYRAAAQPDSTRPRPAAA